MAVLSVGADDCVIRLETGHGTDRDRFLTDVEMEEAAVPAIEFGALLLKPADARSVWQSILVRHLCQQRGS